MASIRLDCYRSVRREAEPTSVSLFVSAFIQNPLDGCDRDKQFHFVPLFAAMGNDGETRSSAKCRSNLLNFTESGIHLVPSARDTRKTPACALFKELMMIGGGRFEFL